MITFFDTETTGLPLWKIPSDDTGQPHLVQLAIIRMAEPEPAPPLAIHNALIRPDGWEISAEVSAIHGITHERAMDEGIPEAAAVEIYLAEVRCAVLRAAHNIAFDDRLMRIAMLRMGMTKEAIREVEDRQKFCTMQAATPIVKCPPTDKMKAAGFHKFKSATMTECVRFFFGEALDGAHDALVDVRACARVYWHLQGASAPVTA